ncbi:hypothetical protein D9V86_09040 [Bacteroidetes/Chlorobi group bacterium ChocPot_Mid]|nr:MAG: hypothetical protein D9V86_09040 [Bacteroidetes/Chlorobi group bacterium ChocPot_Mid]
MKKNRNWLAFAFLWVISINTYSQDVLNLSPNAIFYISPNSNVAVMGNLNTSNNSTFETHAANLLITGDINNSGNFSNSATITLAGDINNSSTISTFGGLFWLNGNVSQTFSSPSELMIDDLVVDKSSGDLELNTALQVDNNIYLISDSKIELKTFNLTVGTDGDIFSNFNGSSSFTANKCISNSSGTFGGALIYKINAGNPIQQIRNFPLGTPGVYTPGKITLNHCTFNSGAYFGMRAINREHPRVEKSPASLTKYWNVFSDNIVVSDNGADLIFYYDPAEVNGNESAFIVMYYKPAYPDPAGYWRIDPGQTNQVAWWGNYRFYTQETDSIDGDWTAGEEIAARSTYYSRANGKYNDKNTWSKDNFGGPVSDTYPNKQSDIVRISNNSVTITEPVASANLVSVEAGGELVFTGNNFIHGDTARLMPNSKIVISHENGITESGYDGNIHSLVRDLNSDVIYQYSGTFTPQRSGDGLPSNVRCLAVDKPNGKIMEMSKVVEIKDSLVIRSGSLDIGSYSINGKSSNRKFTMENGELIVRGAYPFNYEASVFTSGTITFWKDGNNTYVNIPSTMSTPAAVNQYKNLVIKGNRTGASAVTFSNAGQTVINGIFDISKLEFDVAIPRFNMDGSKIIFNQNGGIQDIPCSPGSVPDSIKNIEYYDLTISGSGVKRLNSPFNPTFVVVNDLTLESSTFSSNGFNLEVNQNWTNIAGVFNPGTDAVIFNAPISIYTNSITSRSTTDNPFYNVVISGSGQIQPVDNILINNNLKILASARLTMPSSTISPVLMDIKGNWRNEGGLFTPGSSTVTFSGTTSQTMTNLTGNENFYTLKVDNGGRGLFANGVGTTSNNGIFVTQFLDLSGGILFIRGRFAQINNNVVRNGLNPGHVDGSLRRNIPTGATSRVFDVGYGTSYTPVLMDFNGAGGTAGIIDILSDSLTTSTTPISTTGAAIVPAGSNIMDSKNIRRQYIVTKPTGSTFDLGTARTYNATLGFISGNSPAGDVRGGGDFNQFDVRLWTGTAWIGPDRYGQPRTGTRTANSTQFSLLSDIGTFIIGEPEHLSFYSIGNGNWSTPSNWSTQHYFGSPTTIVPTNDGYIYIGNGKTINVEGNKTVNGFVWIDSAGTLMTGTNILSGTGDFFLQKDGALGIGNENGITTAGPTGNIQTANRFYNVGTHNRGHFIYTDGTDNQPTGNGLPLTVATLSVKKTAGTNLRMTNHITISDSLFIESGILHAREPATAVARNIELRGNLNIGANGLFNPYQGDFTFISGNSQNVTSLVDISFYNLTLINTGVNKRILFVPTNVGGMRNVTILNQLLFTPTNRAYIDLSPNNSTVTSAPVYNSGEWVMTIDQAATGVARLGEGHISGELRKWLQSGTFAERMYEIGHDSAYTPFAFTLTNAGGVAGLVGMQVIPMVHFYSDFLDDAAYNYQQARMIQKYWRMTRPAESGFTQGGRTMAFRARYRDPKDIPGGALKRCFDITYWKGGANNNWQRLSPPSNLFNDASASACGDRNINAGEATYRTFGTDTSTTAHSINGALRTLANVSLGLATNNRFLLGDFVVAQQGPAITYYYSKNNGPWNSAATWVTSNVDDDNGYNGAVNSTNSWPKRRLDVAKIGNGKTVTLNCNIGSGYAGTAGSNKFFEQRLGSCIVEKTAGGPGKLILNTFQMRASAFELHDGGILSTGAIDGFHDDLSRGNIIRQYGTTTIARDFNYENHNRGNYEFTALGTISQTYLQTLTNENYCTETNYGNTAGSRYINDIWIDNGASYAAPPDVFSYQNTGNQRTDNSAGFRYFCDTTIRLTAGNQYTVRVNTAGAGTPYYVVMYFDSDFNGVFTDNSPTEEFPVGGVGLGALNYADITFTVPATAPTGTTRMRFKLRQTNSPATPCQDNGGNNGEAEDYTVFITRPGYTCNQQTGFAIPDQIASVTINTTNASSTVTQTSGLSMSDSLLLQKGTFIPNTFTAGITDFTKYSFISESRPFVPLTGATVPSLSGGTPDEGFYLGIPIGFDFAYHGNIYTTVSASTNGFLSFGTAAPFPANDLANNGGAARPLVAPLWDNLDLTSGQFSYKTEGIQPNRTFIAEWNNVEWDASAAGPVISFQVRLLESTGEVEFHYSQKPVAVNAGSASIGLTATTTGAGNFLSLDGTGVAPGLSTTVSTNVLTAKPLEGQVYRFRPKSGALKLQGDFINNSATLAMGYGTVGTIEFNGTANQKMRGSFSTDFYNVNLNNQGNSIILETNEKVNNLLTFKSNNFLALNQKNLILGTDAGAISPYSGAFSANRMILSSATPTVGNVIKLFNTNAGPKQYFFPIGVSGVYNPCNIMVEGTYSGTPSISIGLHAGLHPNRLKDEMLSKYWTLDLDGITSVTSNSFTFNYVVSDVNGNNARYIPALYQAPPISDWEINVGLLPKAFPTPIEVTNTPYIEGDWTAGEANSFFDGRIFYSRNTGNWNTGQNWSNDKILKHLGPPSSYYPSQLFDKDSVIIDGHTIDYNIAYGKIDTMKIGGTHLGISTAGRGILDFTGSAINRRTLEVNRNLEMDVDGRINSSSIAASGRRDTLIVNGSISNISDGSPGIDGGFYLNQGNDDYVILKFSGTESSTVTGEGNWGNPLVEVHLDKVDDLADTLTCKSNSFAAATGTNPFLFYLLGGVLTLSKSSSTLSLPDPTFTLSSGAQEVSMEPGSGINVTNGLMQTKQTLNTNVITTINVDGGTLEVGDQVDEHLYYQTGTRVSVVKGLLDVAGCFEKLSYKYVINCDISQNGVFRVLNKGNTSIALKGFNVSNESSTFSMNGGRVIVAQSSNGASNDYEVSSGFGLGMINGATIQIGDTVIAPPSQNYKIAGTTPMFNLHYVGSGSTTQITQQNLYIKNNWTIDDNHLAEINDNTIFLGGNLFNYGILNMHTAALTTDARQLVLTGSSNTQTLYNEDVGGLELYNLKIDKPSGLVLLGNDNSYLIVRNTLEFSLNNQAIINARTNSQYVELSPVGNSNPLVARNGLGHVNGLMYRHFPPGNITRRFFVGGDTAATSFRPVIIETIGSGGTAGLIGVTSYNIDHSQLSNSTIKTTTNVPRYWNVSTLAPFNLGTRTYKITTQFVNPGDLRNSPNLFFFQHGFYSPPLPSPFPPSTWDYPQVSARSDTTVTTVNNVAFGDYVVGEPLGVFFYSYNSGDWYDANSWSLDGYTTKTTFVDHLPGQGVNDFVFIGNGKRINLPAGGPYPTVKAVTVEVFNGLPGELFIGGEIGYVKGDLFRLNDSCTLGIQNLQGIEGVGNIGAIRMTVNPFYGVSRYVYYSSYGPQIAGKAMPSLIKTLFVDNTFPPPNNRVFISTFPGATDIEIIDSLYIKNGELNCGNRDIHLYGNMYMLNNAKFDPLSRKVIFQNRITSPSFNRLVLGNAAGANFYNLEIPDMDLVVSTEPTIDLNNSHIFVKNNLLFTSATDKRINVRDNSRKVIIMSGATLTRTQNKGYIDGILQKPIGAGSGSYLFEIGNGNAYTPATITFDAGAGGVAGGIDGVNLSPVPYEPLTGNRLDPAKSIPRYWSMTAPTGSAFSLGTRNFNLKLQFPPAELLTVNTAKASVRRKSIPTEVPLWSQRFGSDLVWNPATASVELNPLPTAQWPGLGEFYIGEKLPRNYYSRQTGNWNDYLTWTLDPSHVGAAVLAGEYPNMDASEVNDNVEIGLNHIVTLNVAETKIDTLKVKHDSKLDMLSNRVNCFDCPISGLFSLSENATISFAGLSVPSNTWTMANFTQYIVGPNSTIEFYGTQTLPANPFGLAQYNGNVLINLTGTKIINTPLTIFGNLTVSNSAILLINNIDAARVLSNVINSATLVNQGVLEIGTP